MPCRKAVQYTIQKDTVVVSSVLPAGLPQGLPIQSDFQIHKDTLDGSLLMVLNFIVFK